MKRILNNSYGFTMVELVIIFSIIGVLSVIAVPNILIWQQQANLRSETLRLYSVLQTARSVALKESRRVCVNFSLDGAPTQDNYQAHYDDTTRNGALDVGESLLSQISPNPYFITQIRRIELTYAQFAAHMLESSHNNNFIVNELGICNTGTVKLRIGQTFEAIITVKNTTGELNIFINNL
ncbi:MAG: GspH/FimT family pseudopilin [Desulfobacterales bacterium]|nr:GspH/FimT family pseudopilin [Desulfobacterales bacterium]